MAMNYTLHAGRTLNWLLVLLSLKSLVAPNVIVKLAIGLKTAQSQKFNYVIKPVLRYVTALAPTQW